jgi:septal ring factor EnvC (AmiA/AmiB activator)
MASDPYQDMTREELEATGATAWLDQDLAEQQRRDAALKSTLGQDTSMIKATRQRLKGMLGELPPQLEPVAPVEDLFAAERAAAAQQTASLSSLVGDLEKSKEAEKDLLRDLFGS